ncbi:MAG TPA: beta galactosidase jelly roll domain-containing protein [Candidatus Acidoferrales bacterium]|nr:beta galactosidase jelly roll domain-containing protein [Candidatus Acidoferrales bacterium]
MKSLMLGSFLAVFLSSSVYSVAIARTDENHRLYNLRGEWKFQLGDNPHWAEPNLNDDRWDEIYVPSTWEDEGYPGYDGFAWYRKHFDASSRWMSKDLILDVGMIDDADEVYVNGELVGSMGSFPPNFVTAYNVRRSYPIPQGLLKPDGDNVIAVRVYDDHGVGGITDGPVGIYEREYLVHPDISLPSMWKFRTGDNMEWKGVAYDDSDWKNVSVPAYWETQGFKDYDGYAWYRVKFNVPADFQDEDLILLVGKVDDFDETYLNGERVGRTGPMPKYEMDRPDGDEYDQMRAYMIPAGLLQPGKDNVLAVRVYDCWLGGGIYDGPIGITTRHHYQRDRHWYRRVENWFDRIIEDIFN